VKSNLLCLLLFLGAVPVAAQSWERLGPDGGMVLSLAAGSDGVLYLGTNDGHVFQSVDRGASWNLRGRAGSRTDAIIAQMAVSAKDPHRVFAAVWFREVGAGGGIFRSEDGGATWHPSGLQGEAVRAIEFAPSQPEMLAAGTRSGVFRSTNEGRTWERISPPDDPELRNVDSVAIDPADANVIYAGTYHLPWKTTDGGKTWKSVSAGLIDDSDIMSMRVDAANPARLYLSACSGIYRSEDRGGQWTKLQGIPYAARRTQAIVQDPQQPATLYAATTEGLWVTRDAGESWERTTPKEWVVNGVAVLPGKEHAAERVVIGTEAQGVLVSEDSGKAFTPSNHGFAHQVAKQLVGDPRDPAHLLLLLERNGVELLESFDAGINWSSLAAIAKGPEAKLWGVDRLERVYGSPWGWLAQLSNGTYRIYMDSAGEWRPWIPLGPMRHLPGKNGTSIYKQSLRTGIAPQGRIFFSQESAYLPLMQGVLRCNRAARCESVLAFSKARRASAIWVSLNGQFLGVVSEGKFGFSRDSGNSTLWRDLPVGVPDANAVLWDPAANSTLFLATDGGLYFSSDTAQHWTLSQDGLPAGVVTHVWASASGLVVTLEQGGVYLSPDGRGNWTRLDQDAERSRMNGMVQTNPKQLVFASQSEGVLKWKSPVQP